MTPIDNAKGTMGNFSQCKKRATPIDNMFKKNIIFPFLQMAWALFLFPVSCFIPLFLFRILFHGLLFTLSYLCWYFVKHRRLFYDSHSQFSLFLLNCLRSLSLGARKHLYKMARKRLDVIVVLIYSNYEAKKMELDAPIFNSKCEVLNAIRIVARIDRCYFMPSAIDISDIGFIVNIIQLLIRQSLKKVCTIPFWLLLKNAPAANE